MKIKHMVISLIILFVSCDLIEESKLESVSKEDILREVMAKPIVFPSGMLSQVVVFSGNTESVSTSREIYYPILDSVTYHVIRDYKQDTISIGLNLFSKNNQVKSSLLYTYINDKPVWQSTKEYSYNDLNLLEEVFITSNKENKKVLVRYIYNSKNLLIKKEYPFSTGKELELFEYDLNNKILNHWKSKEGLEELKIEFLVYRYNGEQLEAKESGFFGNISSERKDAFRYFYDQIGRLSIEEEFDPYFGFQQKSKIQYYYHQGANK